MPKIVIINGPNLNLLGMREVNLYGKFSMQEVLMDLQQYFPKVDFDYRQSNHEGDLIDWIQQIALDEKHYKGLILNAGGLTHTSICLRDAVASSPIPVVEVHITDIYAREAFRQKSLLADVCRHSIVGKGTDGYRLATQWLMGLA